MDERARKISETMRTRKIDNFKEWREKQRLEGNIKSSYPPLVKNGDLAELVGVIWGDGHIYKHDRCDSLRITGDSSKPEFIYRSAHLIEIAFHKSPRIAFVSNSNAMTVTIYEKFISKRLAIPCGSRSKLVYTIPKWILNCLQYQIRFLRGLYEAEGSLCFHDATYTNKFIFTNTNESLLKIVFELTSELGFHPHRSHKMVQISRKVEVQKIANLLQFRSY